MHYFVSKGDSMDESLNHRLRRLREERNITATQMARQINVATSTYRDWESGKRTKFPPLLRICEVLAISVTELITGQNIPADTALKDLEILEQKLREIRFKLISHR